MSRDLTALLVDENYLYAEEGKSLMQAFRVMNIPQFSLCKTHSLLNHPTTTEIKTCDSNYEAFEQDYLEYEDDIQY